MTRSTFESYREVASALTPSAVTQFLASHDWELELQQPSVREIWRYRSGPLRTTPRVMIPLATDFADFTPRFVDALESLGHIHDWDAGQLLERVIATRADLFFVRLNQEMIDGTIPFRQAERTLHSILKMMKAAGTAAADPHHSHRGRRPAAVSEFLNEDVRLGHTKHGSFVFTVVSRLGDVNPHPTDGGGRSAVPFSRRVMETLARGLETTKRLTHSWGQESLESPSLLGLCAELVESLDDMSQLEHLRSLDLSFEWAAAERRPDVGLATIVLDQDLIVELPRVRELVRREEPVRRETLVGPVKSLAREDSTPHDEEAGTAIIAAEVHGKTVRIHVPLVGEDHGWAIIAYEQRLPFTVSGDLSYQGRAWRLTGHIEVDSSSLRHRFASEPPESGDS